MIHEMCMSTTLGIVFVSCQKQINIDECLKAGSFMLQLNSLDDKNSRIIQFSDENLACITEILVTDCLTF